MANKSITQLQVATPLTGMEAVPIVQNGVTKQTLTSEIAALAQLTPTGVTPGTYGDASNVAQITVNEFGQITDAVDVAITGGGGTAPVITATNGIFTNAAVITADTTIAAGFNAMSAGPITVNAGVTVTVVDGTWTIVGQTGGGGGGGGNLPTPYGVAGDVLVSTGASTTPVWEVLDGGSF